MATRKEKAVQTRAKIVAAAVKLVKEKGYDQTSVNDIVKEAGVAKGSFYVYFKNKEEIVGEISLGNFTRITLDPIFEDKPIFERLTGVLTSYICFIVESGLQNCQKWTRDVASVFRADGEKLLNFHENNILSILQDAVKKQELQADAPIFDIAKCITAQFYGITFCWAITDGKCDPIKMMQTYCEMQLKKTIKQFAR